LDRLETDLTELENKMARIAALLQSPAETAALRGKLAQTLAAYRGKMSADQFAMLERQHLEQAILSAAGLPRLTLFYLLRQPRS
jgi:hypothetical protein